MISILYDILIYSFSVFIFSFLAFYNLSYHFYIYFLIGSCFGIVIGLFPCFLNV